MTLVSFIFFTALVGVITYLLTRRDNHDTSAGYFLGGRKLGGIVIAGSLLLTNLSTEQMVGLNGLGFKDGLSVMAWEVIAVVALVAMALFFLPRYLRSGITTLPQLLEERFDHGTHMLATIIFLFAYAVILLPIILYTGARGLSEMIDLRSLLGIDSDIAVVAVTAATVGVVGSIYALWGGLRTVAVSDTVNGVGLLIGGVMIVLFGLAAIGDGQGIVAGMETIVRSQPDRWNSVGGPKQSVPFGTLFTGVLLLHMFYWTTNQQIIQRTFGARNLQAGQKGVLLCGALKLIGPLYLVVPGIIAYHLYSGDPTITPDAAYGTLVRNVLPAPLTGFFLAVMVGAILSSFNSVLNSACTLFSIGIYKGLVRPNATEHQVVRSGQLFGVVIAVVAMVIAPMLIGQDSIFSYLQKMNGLYFIPIFAVVTVGLLTRRVPAIAAKTALIVGLFVIAFGYFVPIGTEAPSVDAQNVDPINLYIAGGLIHDYHFLGIVFIGLVILMLIIGRIRPLGTEWRQAYSGEVDVTWWRYAWPCGIALLIFVMSVYAVFADFSVLTP